MRHKPSICGLIIVMMGVHCATAWAVPKIYSREQQATSDHRESSELYSRIRSLKGATIDDEDLEDEDKGKLRRAALRTEAISFATKAGLAWRYGQIEELLKEQNQNLEVIYNFSAVLMDQIVLPPVITKAENGFRLNDPESARSTKLMYRVEHKARIVTVPPHWRDFLIKNYKVPEDPAWSILPRDEVEREIWTKAVDEGWSLGVRQANSIYKASVGTLTRIFSGILTYKLLLSEGVVSKPVLAKSDIGITYDGRELNVGDTLFRITSQPGFRSNDNWTPLKRDETQVSYPD